MDNYSNSPALLLLTIMIVGALLLFRSSQSSPLLAFLSCSGIAIIISTREDAAKEREFSE
ncbi:hypothetical protein CW304_26060 [Bacillus sp. UFRGS-B20]|nr:hypothetical protein CW304_26060 [Bacillus sp. UFRGS-B20]